MSDSHVHNYNTLLLRDQLYLFFSHLAFINLLSPAVVIGFNQTSYSAMEGIPGKICVVIVSGSIARSVSFTVTLTGGTASGNGVVTDNNHFL